MSRKNRHVRRSPDQTREEMVAFIEILQKHEITVAMVADPIGFYLDLFEHFNPPRKATPDKLAEHERRLQSGVPKA